MPQISIITVNYNNKKGLERTIKSVAQQVFKNYEHIIIDAASTDGSLQVIKANQNQFGYWVSERDNGIYHGMNKGIDHAKGKYLLFLNSGDYLIDERVLDIDFENLQEDILYGHLTYKRNDQYYSSIYDNNLDLGFFFKTTLPHGSSFIKKDLFTKYGYYNTEYVIVSDWIFFLERILFNNCTTLHLNKPISLFEVGGISTKPENKCKVEGERKKYLETILPDIALDYIKKSILVEEKLKELTKQIASMEKLHRAEINNLTRLKGFKLLKKINVIIDRCYELIVK
tara:strand:+ start:4423 stop:5277 length:855 start_codon:yes stop_codon:yes gene_type:complete